MSIAAFVINNTKSDDPNFYIPIATEDFFEKYWRTASQELGLEWIPLFQFGLEITIGDMSSLNVELEVIKEWAEKRIYLEEDKEHLLTRVKLLQDKLNEIFSIKKDIQICIG